MSKIVPLHLIPSELTEQLLDRAFGDDRRARTAYKIREGTQFLPGLSFAALDEDDYMVGLIQAWPVALFDEDEKPYPLIMVGPVAVLPEHQGGGYGKILMFALQEALEQSARDGGHSLPQVMIGDPEYYGRFFGFHAAPASHWKCPGPFEQHRLLVRCENTAILPKEGMLGPWKGAPSTSPSQTVG